MNDILAVVWKHTAILNERQYKVSVNGVEIKN
jgi:hypothetical protein